MRLETNEEYNTGRGWKKNKKNCLFTLLLLTFGIIYVAES